MAEIYIQKLNDQAPHSEEEILEAVKNGRLAPNDLACLRGMNEWKPLYMILQLPNVMPPPGKLENEIALLNQYAAEIGDLSDTLGQCDPQTAKHLQIQIEQKMQIYWKQICLVKTQFPNDEAGSINEAKFYAFQALTLLFSAGMMRRMSDRSESVVFGVATGLIAKQQEKKNAQQAIALLDKALSIYDFAMIHTIKANVFRILGDNQSALHELNYIISNFPDDELYIEARQMKDEIENPPKKSGCFIATAAYGSPAAPEVTVFRQYRDKVLLNSRSGTAFVRIYYFFSPPAAFIISKVGWLKSFVRIFLLQPLLKLLKNREKQRGKNYENV